MRMYQAAAGKCMRMDGGFPILDQWRVGVIIFVGAALWFVGSVALGLGISKFIRMGKCPWKGECNKCPHKSDCGII
jgi:hypothetical protein